MQTLNRTNLQTLRDEIDTALATVAQKHGLRLTCGRCTFNPQNATFRLEVATVGDGGTAMDPARIAYLRDCAIFGLKPEWLDREFTYNGDRFRLSGLHPGRSKFPLVAIRVDNGKTYKFGLEGVRALLLAIPV